MKKEFHVLIREVHVSCRLVEASSPEEAIALAKEGNHDLEELFLEYSHTLDADSWTVEEVE